jgi:hypothetical protein
MLAPSEMNLTWETVAPNFAPDGALRDLYVADTTRGDWQCAIDFVHEHCTDIVYTRDSEPERLPANVDEAFATRPDATASLAFRFGPVHFVTHFFVEEELEFDFWPKDIQEQHEFDSLLQFIRQLGDLLAKPVGVSFESSRDTTFLTYEPTLHEFHYIPPVIDRNA